MPSTEKKDGGAVWADGWISGAVAMLRLMTNGTRKEWERDRDEFLAASGWLIEKDKP